MKPSIGRIVHYVLLNGQHRAATVVNAWPDSAQNSLCNLTVHLDGMNDLQPESSEGGALSMSMAAVRPGYCVNELVPMGAHAALPGVLSVGSASQDEDTKLPGTWHWPERE
jgi:hypothetical protein